MIQMILTEEQQRILAEAKEPVEIVDRDGRHLTTIQNRMSDTQVSEILTRSRASGDAGVFSDLVDRLKKQYPIST